MIYMLNMKSSEIKKRFYLPMLVTKVY